MPPASHRSVTAYLVSVGIQEPELCIAFNSFRFTIGSINSDSSLNVARSTQNIFSKIASGSLSISPTANPLFL